MKKIVWVLFLSFLMSLMAIYAQTDLETSFEEDIKKITTFTSYGVTQTYLRALQDKYKNGTPLQKLRIVDRLFVYSSLYERYDECVKLIPEYMEAAQMVSKSDYFSVCRRIIVGYEYYYADYPDMIIEIAQKSLKLYSNKLPVPVLQKKYISEERWKQFLNSGSVVTQLNTSLGWGYYYKKNYSKALKYWPEIENRYLLLHKGAAFFELQKYEKAFRLIYLAKYYYDLDVKKYPEGLEEYYTKTLAKLPKNFNIEQEKTAVESNVKQTLLTTLSQYEKKQNGIPFALDIINGESVSLESLQGKVVVLNLWSEGCGYCISEIPVLSKLHKEYADKGVVIIGANIGRKYSVDDLAMLKEKYGLEHPIANMAKELSDTFFDDGIPQTYIYDKNGQLRYYVLGFSNGGYIVFKAQIDTLLAE